MIYVIAGPTGSGKSALALKLAEEINGVIVNGDAFQVYKEMDIGTAKPSIEQRKRIPHLLYDFVDLSTDYNVFLYQEAARKIIATEKRPLIFVGGTGLYLRATFFDYDFSPLPPIDMTPFEKLNADNRYQVLQDLDPLTAAKLHPNNERRVLRAIEIALASGENKSTLEAKQEHKLLYDVEFIGVDYDRNHLYELINLRVDRMIEQGLFEEADEIFRRHTALKHAAQAIGYHQILLGRASNKSKTEIVEDIKKASRNYAKRQMTFFRHQLPMHWFDSWDAAYKYIIEERKKNGIY
ncbi:MAG: tRNA (adenosine(37)-N6)-dimethylallyltransferase MiaA [Bacilli bacterium]|jgi:tRNA dimethylallyltransferase|nr:tRNA (adenosine(37)-N6)-dimethylallyltransferase MiaA [Bacilli bacterium]MCH4235707.1 tRNA (adenosine(37)-N6)-dimethylallyltransferase MiaA [Bacilli bacterium]